LIPETLERPALTKAQLTPDFIKEAVSDTAWDFGNQVLYDMCKANPEHKSTQVIIGKIWLIGRTYAAAVERRRNKGSETGDAFYEEVVAPKIRQSDIDIWFEAIRASNKVDVALHLQTHARVTNLLTEISGLEKRSLASKYLHFHFPELFYIYDSRAQNVVSALTEPLGRRLPALQEHDHAYAQFFFRCRDLQQRLASLAGRSLSLREFDKVLLAFDRQRKPILPTKAAMPGRLQESEF